MVWTSPRTWVAGEAATDSVLNQQITFNLEWLGADDTPAFSFGGSTVTIAGGTAYTFTNMTSAWIRGPSSQFFGGKFVCQRAGLWVFGARVRGNTDASTTTVGAYIYNESVGPDPIICGCHDAITPSADSGMGAAAVVYGQSRLSVGHVVSLRAWPWRPSGSVTIGSQVFWGYWAAN